MELILVRHGESEGNVQSILYGSTDYPLTEKGSSQIPHIIKSLEPYEIDRVVSSPLIRAKTIGNAISKAYDLPIAEDDRLREIHFGDYENKDRNFVIDQVGKDGFKSMISFFDSYPIPGGEHQDEFLGRVRSFVDELLREKEGTYVLTAHYGVLVAVLTHLLDYKDDNEVHDLKLMPGAIVKLTIEEDKVKVDRIVQTYDMV